MRGFATKGDRVDGGDEGDGGKLGDPVGTKVGLEGVGDGEGEVAGHRLEAGPEVKLNGIRGERLG